MKAQFIWALVNTRTGKLARDPSGGIGYATRKALKDCFDDIPPAKDQLNDPRYEIRKIEVKL